MNFSLELDLLILIYFSKFYSFVDSRFVSTLRVNNLKIVDFNFLLKSITKIKNS